LQSLQVYAIMNMHEQCMLHFISCRRFTPPAWVDFSGAQIVSCAGTVFSKFDTELACLHVHV
jgi:hypothetical protein